MSSYDAIVDTKFHILCNISNFNPYKMTKCKWILNESDIVTDCLRPFLWNMCWNCILKLFVDNCYFVSLTLPQNNECNMTASSGDYVNDFSGYAFQFSFFIIHQLDFMSPYTDASTLLVFALSFCRSNINYNLISSSSFKWQAHTHEIVLLIYWRC